MNEQDSRALFERYVKGDCTTEEQAIVESWYIDASFSAKAPAGIPDYDSIRRQSWKELRMKHRSFIIPRYVRYAATILLIAGLSWGYYTTLHKTKEQIQIAIDIQPGGNKATLTLANGKQINLDDVKSGTIASQAGVTIAKNANGEIVYSASPDNSAPSLPAASPPVGARGMEHNIITTPNGGQYQVILPDGSHVYLNAASSLKYPVRFASDRRSVTLTGEGYFEITKKARQPFIVTTSNQTIKVLGTDFDVSAYPNETTITTLAEGSVELFQPSSNLTQRLKPNEQSELLSTGFSIKTVNAEEQVAWKDGQFIFRQTPLIKVLQQISRWYNIEVDYSNVPNMTISADISKSLELSRLLNVLKTGTGVKIVLNKERRLTVEQ